MKEKGKKVNKVKIAVGYLSHMLVTLVMFAGVAYFVNEIILEKEWNENYFMYASALFGIIALYSLLDCKRLYSYFRTEIILIFCFLVSALLLLLSDYYINVPLWLIGGIAAAALVNRNIGILYVYFFVFHAIYLQEDCLNGLVFHFVCATILCILIPKMKTWVSMLYMMVFTGALVIVMTIVINQFIVDKLILLDAFSIMCTYFVCIIFTMFFVSLVKPKQEPVEETVQEEATEEVPVNYEYLELMAQDTEAAFPGTEDVLQETKHTLQGTENVLQETENTLQKQEELVPVQRIIWSENAASATDETDRTGIIVREDFTDYCNEKSELLQELKKQKKAVYAHAILAGKLAFRAAESVDLNATLAKAAALYEAIIKLYPEEDVDTVLTELELPETLSDAVISVVKGKINTKETAVVSMADDIISNYTVIRHMKKMALAPEKIVDKTLDRKMFSGAYDESGLKVSEYSGLRNAFVAFLNEQDKRLS